MKTSLKYSAVLVISLLVLSGSIALFMPSVVAQSYGKNGTFARGGMQITYSISGVTVTNSSTSGAQLEGGGSATSLALVGTVYAGAKVTVSGSFIADNTAYSDNAGSATVRAGSATNSSGSIAVPPSSSGSYSLTLTVPDDASSLDVSIGQGSNDASWGFGITGSFDVQTLVDHITIVSPYDSVSANANPFPITANVYGPGNSAVRDGTLVNFTLTDQQRGDLAGASIYPNPASTTGGAVSVTFTPPGASYWSDSLHSSFSGQNYIMITAIASGVSGSKTIDINQAGTSSTTPTATAATSSVGTLMNTLVTLDSATPSESYYYTLDNGQVISIDIGVTGDPVDFTIFDSSGNQVYSQTGIDTDPVYHWTAPYSDMFEFMIATTGSLSNVSLNLEAANSQGGRNSFLLIGVLAVIVIVIIVAVLFFVMRGRNRSKAPSQQYQQPTSQQTQPIYQQTPVQQAPPVPPPQVSQPPQQPTYQQASYQQAPPVPQPQVNRCPTCGAPLRWIAEYQRWYCDREQKYL